MSGLSSSRVGAKELGQSIVRTFMTGAGRVREGLSMMRQNLPEYMSNVRSWLKTRFGQEPDVTLEASRAGLHPVEYRAGLAGVDVSEYLSARAMSTRKLNPKFLFMDAKEFEASPSVFVDNYVKGAIETLSEMHGCSPKQYVSVVDSSIAKAMGDDYGSLGREVLAQWGMDDEPMEMSHVSLGNAWESVQDEMNDVFGGSDVVRSPIVVKMADSGETVRGDMYALAADVVDGENGLELVADASVFVDLPLSQDVLGTDRFSGVVSAASLDKARSADGTSYALAGLSGESKDFVVPTASEDGRVCCVVSSMQIFDEASDEVYCRACTGRMENGLYVSSPVRMSKTDLAIEQELGNGSCVVSYPADGRVTVLDSQGQDKTPYVVSGQDFSKCQSELMSGDVRGMMQDFFEESAAQEIGTDAPTSNAAEREAEESEVFESKTVDAVSDEPAVDEAVVEDAHETELVSESYATEPLFMALDESGNMHFDGVHAVKDPRNLNCRRFDVDLSDGSVMTLSVNAADIVDSADGCLAIAGDAVVDMRLPNGLAEFQKAREVTPERVRQLTGAEVGASSQTRDIELIEAPSSFVATEKEVEVSAEL